MSNLETSEDWLEALGVQHRAAAGTPETPNDFEELSEEAISEQLRAAAYVNGVASNASSLGVGTFRRDQAIERARIDLNFFAVLILGDIAQYNFPPVFLAAWQLLTAATTKDALRLFPKLCLGLPRGFGKTTFVKLFICWCVLYTEINFILITAATAGLAENILADVMDMLSEENIAKLFGDWRLGVEKDTQALKKFAWRSRDIIIAAIGAEGSLRGLNLKHRRPQLIVMDDIQKREDADSVELSEKLLTWILGTLMKTKPYTGCCYVFLGNMYPGAGSILKKLKDNPTWTSFICGAILADGQSIWPELVSVEQLLTELQNDTSMGHPEIFFSEVMNDPEASSRSGIDVSKIPGCPVQIADGSTAHQGACVIIDPASGKANGNDVAIGLWKVFDGKPYLADLKADKYSPGQTIEIALKFALQAGTRLIIVEGNGYQYTLLYWFDFMCKQLHLEDFHLVEAPYSSFSKNEGIKQALQALLKGEICLYPAVRAAVVYQIIYWNPLKRDNQDDVLDLLRMINPALSEFSHLMAIEAPVTRHAATDAVMALAEMAELTQMSFIQ